MNWQIHPLLAFRDNYIWTLTVPKNQTCVVVDPGDAAVVHDHITEHGLTLTHILITHHHWDHTNGVNALIDRYPDVQVIAPEQLPIRFLRPHRPVGEGDNFTLPGIGEVSVQHIPGHTLDHVMYVTGDHAFVGDTLFSCGTGGLFEGTAAMLFASFQKIAALLDDTWLYPTHEYTLYNIRFAQRVEPENEDLQRFREACIQKRNQNLPTLPVKLSSEKACNPFLRCHLPSIQKAVSDYCGYDLKTASDTFAWLRAWKDHS